MPEEKPQSDLNLFATVDSHDFGTKVSAKIKELTALSSGSGGGSAYSLHYANVGVAYQHLYGLDVEGVGANAAVITRSGEQGSIAELRIPGAAGDLTKVWNIVVGPELAWTAVATTTDYASEAESITAKNALQYYWSDKGVSTKAKGVAFEALAFAEGALHVPWNTQLGDDAGVDQSDPNNPKILKKGDIDYRPISTWDIIRDPTAKSWDSLNWVCVREWKNKYDVAASCDDPETAQAALKASAQYTYLFWVPFARLNTMVMSDLIPVYSLYHKLTPSVPGGRQTVFLETGEIITDEKLDKTYYKYLPVVRMAAGEYSGTPYPYSKFSGILGAQQASDGLYRDLLTNATAVSGSIIVVENDYDTPALQLAGGPKVLVKPKNAADPHPLILQTSQVEHYNLLGRLRTERQQILGLDSLTAGEKVGDNLSGAAMAMLTSTSVQNNSQLQANWAAFVQTVGNLTLSHIQHHMSEPRKIALAGKSRADLVITTELSGDKVSGIDRLQVQLGTALQQTDAGKFELAQLMLKQGWAQTPQQLQTVLDTGRLDSLTQDLSNELMLIQSENEALARGEQVAVMLGDDHLLHLKGHRPVTASITARKDPNVVNALQAHEQQHIQRLQTTDPNILKLFNQPSLQAAPPPPPPEVNDATKLGIANTAIKAGWAQTPQQAQAVFDTAKLDAGNPPQGVGAPSPQQQGQQNAANMPTNPSTGQLAAPVAGTIPPALAIRRNGTPK